MGNLFYTIGLQRSGKSTTARKWLNYKLDISDSGDILTRVERKSESEAPRVVVSGDAIRLAMHGQVYASEAEGQVAVAAEWMMRMFLGEGYDVLYDETNTSIDSLKRVYRVSRDAIPVIIDTPMDVCLERAERLGQHYLFPVIKRCSVQKDYLLGNFSAIVADVKDYLKTHN